MKLYLFICFLSHLVLGQFQWQGACQTAVLQLIPLLTKQQGDLANICTTSSLLQVEINKIEGVMAACGLTNWVDEQNDRMVGALFKALFGFVKRLLCYKEANHYCWPQVIKIIPLADFMTLFSSSGAPDFSHWNISCSILANDGIRSIICPTAAGTSGPAMCKKGMVRKFDDVVIKLRYLLRLIPYAQVRDVVKPILKLASDIRLICRDGSRGDVKTYLQYICDPTDTVPEPEWCHIDPNGNKALNRVKRSFVNLLNVKAIYNSTLQLRIGELDLAAARARCCDADCETARQAGVKKVWERVFEITNALGLPDVSKRDIVAHYNGLSDAQKTKLKLFICRDIAGSSTYDPINNCHVIIRTIASGGGRRLLDVDSKLEVTLTTEIPDGDTNAPVDCDNSGSLFLTNDFINSESGTDNQEMAENNCNAFQVAAPTAPTAPTPTVPTAPVAAPTAPVAAPTAPVAAPTAPTPTAPTAPVAAPTAPGAAPTAPVAAPTAPVAAPTVESSAIQLSLSLVPMLGFFIAGTLF